MKTNKKTAVVTGVTGQDGYYLAEYLLSLGYKVVGIDRRTSLPTTDRLTRFMGTPNFTLVRGDVTDLSSIQDTVSTFKPDEFYHLAAQSHVGVSWKTPVATCDITGMGTLNCLEAIRKFKPDCRFYFAGSSEQFGNSYSKSSILNESSSMSPESPYAAAKVFGYNICQVYRRSYDMFTACGILFNHESSVRGRDFVTRKITSQLANIAAGNQEFIELGNMDSFRDWGFAGDYVRAMHAMLQLDEPDDFVIATGETHSVQEFFELTCKYFKFKSSLSLRVNISN
jgi:GDPmannose 4,6-dehydratase